jgi:hypothetical protein
MRAGSEGTGVLEDDAVDMEAGAIWVVICTVSHGMDSEFGGDEAQSRFSNWTFRMNNSDSSSCFRAILQSAWF